MSFWLQIIGLTLNIFGVLLMSYSYYSASRYYHLPEKLIKALWSIKRADLTADLAKLNRPQPGRAFQGLAFILIGFIFQFLALIIPVISQ